MFLDDLNLREMLKRKTPCAPLERLCEACVHAHSAPAVTRQTLSDRIWPRDKRAHVFVSPELFRFTWHPLSHPVEAPAPTHHTPLSASVHTDPCTASPPLHLMETKTFKSCSASFIDQHGWHCSVRLFFLGDSTNLKSLLCVFVGDGRYSLLGQPLQYSLCPPHIMHGQSSYSSHQVPSDSGTLPVQRGVPSGAQ